MELKKKEVMVRINPRISASQHAFIKKMANKKGVAENEVLRFIIAQFITNNK